MLSLAAAVVWVDFFVILLSKFRSLGKSLDVWYDTFGIVAVLSDTIVIVLGVMIASFLVPNASTLVLMVVAVGVQLVHDVGFFYGVIKPIPTGHNRMIDVFKLYATENSWKILVADALMIASTVVGSELISELDTKYQWFFFLLGIYAITFVLYTRNAKTN